MSNKHREDQAARRRARVRKQVWPAMRVSFHHLNIDLTGSFTLAKIEQLVTKYWAPTFRSHEVVFDLEKLESIGLFQATLLTSWCAGLLQKGVGVRVRAKTPLPDGARALDKGGVLRSMRALGVAVESNEPPSDDFGLPLDVLMAPPSQTLLDDAAAAVRRASTDFTEESVRDFCSGVLFELLENASIHGREGAHFGIQIFTSGAIDPFFPSSIEAERYLEIVVGDAGEGIQTLLSAFVPPNYTSPFPTTRPLTPDELTLAYAFEFSSTSNADGRRARLQQYLVEHDLPADRVATGLSCVLNIVRTWQGQLIVRTPEALLSINYTRGRQNPVRTAIDLFESDEKMRKSKKSPRLAPLVGTHFLLRFPARRVPNKGGYSHGLPGSKLQENIDVIAPFPEQPDLTETERVIRAIERVDQHVRERRHGLGLTIVRPSRVPLTARAKALFGAALVAIHRGNRHILCLDRYYTEPAIGDADTYAPPAATDVGVILESHDLFTVDVRNVRVASPGIPEYLVGTTEDGHLRINEQIIRTLRIAYARHIRGDLMRALNAPQVRLTNGPFLIEGQYFTNVFFSVASALSDPYLQSLVVQWVVVQVPVDTEAIIVATAAIEQIVPLMQQHLSALGIEVDIIRPEAGRELRPREKRSVALTDVIARGNVLDAVLQSAQPVFVSAVLALIDARDENDPPNDFAFSAAGTIRRSTLSAILREHIPTYGTVGEAQRARRLVEAQTEGADQFRMYFPSQVQVIDPDTHRPTVYVRKMPPTDPEGNADELLRAAQRASALMVRHVMHQQRHYAVFFDFTKLFRELRTPIIRWINRIVSAATSANRRYLVANLDGSLDWLDRALRESDPEGVVRPVFWNDLRAPDPIGGGPRQGLAVAIIPGSAGGETARRAIELASRGNPEEIVLLIVLARMEPSHLGFLQSTPSYGDAALRVECFGHLPIRAYSDAFTCPLCAARSEVDQTRARIPPPSRLRDVLEEKVERMEAIEISGGTFIAGDDDVTRARLRAWYEAAEYDLDVRQRLTTELDRSPESIDLFLEVVATESKSRHFSLPLMRRRLLKTFGRVIARVNEILWTTDPPYTLAPKIPAVLHLIGAEFVIPAQRLLNAYKRSKEDFQEICIGLSLLPAAPAGAESLLSEMNAHPEEEVDASLLAATIEAVSGPRDDEAGRFVVDFDMLRQCIVNSSLVTVRLPDLIEAVQAPKSKTIGEAALFVYDGWTVEVATLLARLMSSWRWRALAARHSALQEKVVTVARRMNEVHQFAYKLDWSEPDRQNALNVASQVEIELNDAITEICKLRVPPTRIPAIHQDSVIWTKDNRQIRFTSTIDPKVPFVFGHMETLQDVVEEIVENWTLHNEGKDGRAAISLRSEGEFVAIRLSDDLQKPIKSRKNVKGGVSMFEDYCRDYCARVEVAESNAGGMKSVALYLRALPEEKKEPKWMTPRKR